MKNILIIGIFIISIQSCNSNEIRDGRTACLENDCDLETNSEEEQVNNSDTEISTPLQYIGLSLHESADDGYLNASELSESIDIVSEIVASGHVDSLFALVKSNVSCSDLKIQYLPSIQLSSETIQSDDSYKVCVRLEDSSGEYFFAESPSFIVDRKEPSQPIEGVPTGHSSQTTISIPMDDASKYRYAIVDGTDCDDGDFGKWIQGRHLETDVPGADGQKTLCVEAKDKANNKMVHKQTWIKDTSGPSSLNLVGLPSNNSSDLSISVSVVDPDIFSYRYELHRGSDCLSINFSDDWISTNNSVNRVLGSDGEYTICMQGRDLAGNIQSGVTEYTWIKNTSAPGSALLSGLPNKTSAENSILVSVSGPGVADYRFDIVSGTDCSGAIYSGSWISVGTPINQILGPDQSYTLCVIGRNNIGSEQPFPTSYSWTKDSSFSVQAVLSGLPANSSSDTFLLVTVAGPNVVGYRYDLVAASDCSSADFSGVWNSTAALINETLGTDQTYSLCVVGRNASNIEQSTPTQYTWTKDTAAPLADIINPPTGINSTTVLDITIAGLDVTHYRYKVGLGLNCSNSSGYSSEVPIGTKISSDISSEGEGGIKLCVVGRDAVNNYQVFDSASEASWTRDTVAPMATLSGAPSSPSNASNLNVTVGGAGVGTYQFKIVAQPANCSGAGYNGTWIDVSTPITNAIGADGDYKLCVIGQDTAQNTQAESDATTHLWTKDTSTPTAVLAGEPSNPSNSTNLSVSVSGTDVINYKYKLVAQTSACTGGGYSGSWLAVATPITAPIGADGDYKLCVIGRDGALNAQTEASATEHIWSKDTAAPTAVLSGTPTSPSNITSLSVTVGGASVVDYQYKLVSGASACTGGAYNGTWIAIASPITDAIGADGDHKLCIIARDAALNSQTEAGATEHTWTKDTAAPAATLSGTPSNPSNVNSLNVTIAGPDVVDYQYKLVSGANVCTGGGYSSWTAIVTPITDVIGADGDHKLCVVGRDAAQNSQAEASATKFSWTKDSLTPTASLSGTPSDPSGATNLNVSVSGLGVDTYQYKVVAQASLCSGGGYNGSWIAAATPITAGIGADGDYKLCVIGQDSALNAQTEASATFHTWTKDTVASTAVLSGTPSSPSNATTLNATVGGAGIVDYQYKLVSGASLCTGGAYNGSWIAIATPINTPIGADGDHKLCVIGRDAALNAQAEADATFHIWTKDTLAPTASLSGTPSDPSNTTTLNVTIAGMDVVDYQYKLVSGASACTGGSYNGSWIPVATPIADAIGADGDHKLCVIGRDAVQNPQAESSASQFTWTKDTVAPAASLSGTPSNPSNATALNVSISGTDVVEYQYKLVSGVSSCTGGGYGSWTPTATPITAAIGSDGDYRLCVIAQDSAFNEQPEASASFHIWTKDTVPATAVLSSTPNDPSSDSNLNVSVGGIGVMDYQYALVNQAVSCDGATYNGTWVEIATPITATIGADGDYKLCVISRDAVQNEQAQLSASIHTWTKDTLAPTATSLIIDSGADYTSTSSVTLNLTATDVTSMYITNIAGCSSGGAWEAFSNSKSWTLGQTNGPARVYAKFRDQLGNESSCVQDQINHDDISPGSPSITIGSSEYTNAITNTLFLSATLGPTEVYITNSVGCASGGSWEPFSATRTGWSLGNTNSLTNVYAKFRDDAGNESTCISDSITHDGVAPSTPGNLDDQDNTHIATDSPNITWSASTDNFTGIAKYEISIGLSAGSSGVRDWQDIGITTSALFNDLSMIWGQRYYINVRAVDLAGNVSITASSDGFVYGYVQQAYVKAANVDQDDKFGTSVAISGNTMVVGAEGEGSSQTSVTNGTGASSNDSKLAAGAAYVYIRNGDSWAQQAYLKASNSDSNDKFGKAVAISGDTIVVGAHQEQSNQNSITNGSSSSDDDSADKSGAVYVFRRSGSTWYQEAYIKASNNNANNKFGESVAIDGDTIVVGVQNENSNVTGVLNGSSSSNDVSSGKSGAVFVYKRTGSNWAQEAYLKASNADSNDKFGKSVDISGDTIVVGAHQEQSNQNFITNGGVASSNNSNDKSGAVYVFKRTGSLWAQEAYIKAANSEDNDKFGESVAVDGDTIVVGTKLEDSSATGVANGTAASSNNSSSDSGAAYVFKRTGSNWAQQAYIKAPISDFNDKLGKAVAIEGDLIAVSSEDEASNFTSIINGDTSDSDNSQAKSGAVYLFERNGSTWTQISYLKASNSDTADKFGKFVGISGRTVVVGASDEQSGQNTISNSPNASGDNSKDRSGAAYIFD